MMKMHFLVSLLKCESHTYFNCVWWISFMLIERPSSAFNTLDPHVIVLMPYTMSKSRNIYIYIYRPLTSMQIRLFNLRLIFLNQRGSFCQTLQLMIIYHYQSLSLCVFNLRLIFLNQRGSFCQTLQLVIIYHYQSIYIYIYIYMEELKM